MTEVPAIQNPTDQSATVRRKKDRRIAARSQSPSSSISRSGDLNSITTDDAQYLTKNPWVQSGLRRETIAWAFTTGYAGNWHPLTWLSHMLDWQIYGANAGGHHLTSLLFHVANTLLLFLACCNESPARCGGPRSWLRCLRGIRCGRNPSPGWLKGRNVLCAFFGLLSLWAWAGYRSAARKLRFDSREILLLPVACFLCHGICGLVQKRQPDRQRGPGHGEALLLSAGKAAYAGMALFFGLRGADGLSMGRPREETAKKTEDFSRR